MSGKESPGQSMIDSIPTSDTVPTESKQSRNFKRTGRAILIVSVVVLAVVLMAVGYFGFHRARLAGIENERLSRLADHWVLDFDIVNTDKTDHIYYVQVNQGEPAGESSKIVAAAGKVFHFAAYVYLDKVKGDEVTLEVWRDSPEGPPLRTSTYYLK